MPDPDPVGPFGYADRFLEHASLSICEADERHAIVHQSADPSLANHLGVRHAGAIFAAGYAASRALVAAGLAGWTDPVSLAMVDSEIDYRKTVTSQRIEAVAKPDAEWEASLSRARFEQAILPTEVTLSDEEGNVVAAMKVLWRVTPLDAP